MSVYTSTQGLLMLCHSERVDWESSEETKSWCKLPPRRLHDIVRHRGCAILFERFSAHGIYMAWFEVLTSCRRLICNSCWWLSIITSWAWELMRSDVWAIRMRSLCVWSRHFCMKSASWRYASFFPSFLKYASSWHQVNARTVEDECDSALNVCIFGPCTFMTVR